MLYAGHDVRSLTCVLHPLPRDLFYVHMAKKLNFASSYHRIVDQILDIINLTSCKAHTCFYLSSGLFRLTSIDASSMQISSTMERVTFVPTWSCVLIRDFVVVHGLLWTTG